MHLEECLSEHPSLVEREGQKLLCGSILVVMEESEDCIVSGLTIFCQLEVSKSFTVPGRICTDAGDYPAEVECRHNVEYIQYTSFVDSGQDGDVGEGDSSGDGFVIQATIGIILIIGFLAVLNRGNFNLLSREEE